MRKFLLMLMVVVMGLMGSAVGQVTRPDPARMKSSESLRTVFKEVVKGAEKVTVAVQGMEKDKLIQVALGTVVGADGFILTKASEVVGREKLQVLLNGKGVEAKVVGVSEPHDLAMLKVEAKGLAVAEFLVSKEMPVEVGEWVASVGPMQVEGEAVSPFAVGVMSVGRRKIPGRSGFLGVSLVDAKEQGAKIDQVISGSSAEKSGLKVDDVVTAVNGKAVKNRNELIDMVHEFRPGDVVMLTVMRAGKAMEIRAVLGQTVNGGGASRFTMMNLMGGALSKRASDFPVVLQHDTVLRPMDCGGPLVDLEGKVIGVNIARAGRTESYALPGDVIVPLLEPLESGKLAPVNANKAATRPEGEGKGPGTRPVGD